MSGIAVGLGKGFPVEKRVAAARPSQTGRVSYIPFLFVFISIFFLSIRSLAEAFYFFLPPLLLFIINFIFSC